MGAQRTGTGTLRYTRDRKRNSSWEMLCGLMTWVAVAVAVVVKLAIGCQGRLLLLLLPLTGLQVRPAGRGGAGLGRPG